MSRPVLPALLAAMCLVGTAADGGPRSGRAIVRGQAVWLDGAPAWRGAVTSPLVWSASQTAVAFAGRDVRGRAALVVIVPISVGTAEVLIWPIPRSAEPARAVTWLGPTRLGAGPTELEPRIVASFTLDP